MKKVAHSKISKRRHTAISKHRPKRRLSGGLQMANLKGAGMNTIKGGIGGLIYGFQSSLVNKDGTSPNMPYITGAFLSFVASAFLKQSSIGAGIAGAMALGVGQKYGLLKDGYEDGMIEFINPNTMSERPRLTNSNIAYLLEDDQQYIDQDGNRLFPLSDGSFTSVYPNYLNPGFY